MMIPYDELSVDGRIRKQYLQVWRRYGTLDDHQRKKELKTAEGAFHHDANVLPIPLILSTADFEFVRRGTAQRGKAIQRFLHDHYFGGKTYAAKKIVPSSVVARAIERSREVSALETLRPKNLQFWYAPDIIRIPDGSFRVVEDNTGFIGGVGDALASVIALRALGIKNRNHGDAEEFFKKIVGFYQKEALRFGSKKIVMISNHSSIRETHEDLRLAELFDRYSISNLTKSKGITFRGHHAYYRGERIGFFILNLETVDAVTFFTSQGKKNRSLSTSKFWKAAGAGGFGVSYAHGIEFTNDKELYGSVDDMIRFYLKEDPILPSIDTVSLGQRKCEEKVFKNIKDWVIKGAVGKGGEKVWLGCKLTSRGAGRLRRRVARDPHFYVAQPFIGLSRILDHTIDVRPFAMVAPKKVIVSRMLWGRATPVGGSGKVNISHGGQLLLVTSASPLIRVNGK